MNLFSLSVFAAYPQAPDEDKINKLRQEINLLQKKLHQQEAQKEQTIELIETIDQKISLGKNLLSVLRKGIKTKRKTIDSLKMQQAQIAERLNTIKHLIRLRMVSLYKYGQIATVEAIFNARSFNQMKLLAEYQRRLADNDARNFRNYRKRQDQLVATQKKIEANLQEELRLLDEKQAEEKALQKDRKEKSNFLKKIKRDQNTYQRQIEDYQQAIREIQRLIASSEARRIKAKKDQSQGRNDFPVVNDFAKLKGKLPWPANGEIIRHYGPYKHPVLKTVTDNLGIDIQVPLGTEVHAVAAGKVTAITWQRGRGNLIIINHGDGYYTVYTHLDEIYVELQQTVRAGQVIGVVGQAGIFDKPVLHFQIWKRFAHKNPEDWLQK